jgi:Flp pilus assembly protein TadD
MRPRCRASHSLLLALGTVLASITLPTPCHAQQGELGNIVGEVQISRVGLPSKKILVNLQNRGATINSVYADEQGHFGFYALPGGLYHIVIQDDDFDPTDQSVILNPLTSPVSYARVMLAPRSVTASKRAPDRLPGSNPGVVDLKEYTHKFPKKAVNEYEKGLRARAENKLDSAVQHFQKSIESAPQFYPAHNELGRIYTEKSDFLPAQREFEEAIRLNASDAEAHINLGNIFLLTKKYPEALATVQDGLRKDPNSAVGKFILGSIFERTGKFAEAELSLRQALKLDPQMSRVRLELVNLYLAQQKKSEASNELKAFLRDFPNDPLAPRAKEVLNKLQASDRPPLAP